MKTLEKKLEELDTAITQFKLEVCKALYIDKLVIWLSDKLNKFKVWNES